MLAVAEWPLYRRALARSPQRGGLLALGWLGQVQKTGLGEPGWLGALPLVGDRADAFWRDQVGNPQAANDLLGTLSAGSLLGWASAMLRACRR